MPPKHNPSLAHKFSGWRALCQVDHCDDVGVNTNNKSVNTEIILFETSTLETSFASQYYGVETHPKSSVSVTDFLYVSYTP